MLIQICLFVFSCASIWLVGRKEHWKRWGYIIGLAGQPFWYISSIQAEQWGLVALSMFYTYSWAQGIYNYWIKK